MEYTCSSILEICSFWESIQMMIIALLNLIILFKILLHFLNIGANDGSHSLIPELLMRVGKIVLSLFTFTYVEEYHHAWNHLVLS
jgi:hypothetical protein